LDEAIPADVLENLSEEEKRFLLDYDQLLRSYMKTVRLDLTKDIRPPKSVFIEVRVVRDCSIEVDGQRRQFVVNTKQLVRRQHVELLIRRGDLEHVVDKLY
jgi:GINS complex subunit 1